MNDFILVRASLFAALGQVMLFPAAAAAQSANAQLGARSEATIQIRVSVAPRFMTSNQTSLEAGGVTTNVASNAPGLRYKVIAQQQQVMAEGGRGLQLPIEGEHPAHSSTLLLIVPD